METTCTYHDNREEALIAYLYDAVDADERARFEAHVATCVVCRQELDELGAVRTQLAEWAPPEPAAGWMSTRSGFGSTTGRRSWGAAVRDLPAWAQVAAALLLIGVAAGAANLNITYGAAGLSVRTGWIAPALPSETTAPVPETRSASTTDEAPWRAELAALDRQLRTDLTPAVTGARAVERDGSTDEAILRRVRALIEASEKKQQTELAFRVAEVSAAIRSQRVAADRNFNVIQARNNVDILKLYAIQQDLASRIAAR